MTTTPAAKEETPEEIAERIADLCSVRTDANVASRSKISIAVLSALRNEREACAKVADTFQIEMLTDRIPALKAQDNTAKGIAAAIRGRAE